MQKVARNESPSYPSEQDRVFQCWSCKKRFCFCDIINPLLTKLVRSRWLKSGLVICVFLLTSTSSAVNKNAKNWTWPIYSHLERTILVNNACVKKIHDDVHLRLKRASPLMARGRFNFSGENANRQNWRPKTSGQSWFRRESPTRVAWSLGLTGKKCYLFLCRSRSRELTEVYTSNGKGQWRPYFSRGV